jgi:hypothetical protein
MKSIKTCNVIFNIIEGGGNVAIQTNVVKALGRNEQTWEPMVKKSLFNEV